MPEVVCQNVSVLSRSHSQPQPRFFSSSRVLVPSWPGDVQSNASSNVGNVQHPYDCVRKLNTLLWLLWTTRTTQTNVKIDTICHILTPMLPIRYNLLKTCAKRLRKIRKIGWSDVFIIFILRCFVFSIFLFFCQCSTGVPLRGAKSLNTGSGHFSAQRHVAVSSRGSRGRTAVEIDKHVYCISMIL